MSIAKFSRFEGTRGDKNQIFCTLVSLLHQYCYNLQVLFCVQELWWISKHSLFWLDNNLDNADSKFRHSVNWFHVCSHLLYNHDHFRVKHILKLFKTYDLLDFWPKMHSKEIIVFCEYNEWRTRTDKNWAYFLSLKLSKNKWQKMFSGTIILHCKKNLDKF